MREGPTSSPETQRLTAALYMGCSYWYRPTVLSASTSNGGFKVTKTGPCLSIGSFCRSFILYVLSRVEQDGSACLPILGSRFHEAKRSPTYNATVLTSEAVVLGDSLALSEDVR